MQQASFGYVNPGDGTHSWYISRPLLFLWISFWSKQCICSSHSTNPLNMESDIHERSIRASEID